jgi:seryl-tRNA synthetase
MLDIKFIRDNPDQVKRSAKAKNIDVDIDRLLSLDTERRELLQKSENYQAEKNAASKQIAMLEGKEKQQVIDDMKAVSDQQSQIEDQLNKVLEEYQALMLKVPAVISEDTPMGKDETENVQMKIFGDFPVFDFPVKDHVQLGQELGIIDIERGVKVAGARSYFLVGDGARLEQAILKYAQDFISRRGYKLMSVPVVLNQEALVGSGFFPGAEEQTYHLEKDNKYLVGTSEASICAFHSDEMLKQEDLPLRYAGISTCFRREAGTYGKDTHGLYRMHQFNKIEQFIFGKNDLVQSEKYHLELLNNAEEFIQSLHIPYRIVRACSGDLSAKTVKMDDIECWMPSRNAYGETHSCSTIHDFQARRLNIRYKDEEGKVQFCHTLNNTVIATPRILIPILELNQQADGSIIIPEVLQPYMGNQERIEK